MTEAQILATCTRILRDLLNDDSIELALETRRSDVPNWDSFMYVNFIVALEQELGVRFSVTDVESFGNVGEIVQRAHQLLG